MELMPRQQIQEIRSPLRIGSRSGRGGGVAGRAVTAFTAAAGTASTVATAAAATAATDATAAADEAGTDAIAVSAPTKSAKRNRSYSQDLVGLVSALQDLSQSKAPGAHESSPAPNTSEDATGARAGPTATCSTGGE